MPRRKKSNFIELSETQVVVPQRQVQVSQSQAPQVPRQVPQQVPQQAPPLLDWMIWQQQQQLQQQQFRQQQQLQQQQQQLQQHHQIQQQLQHQQRQPRKTKFVIISLIIALGACFVSVFYSLVIRGGLNINQLTKLTTISLLILFFLIFMNFMFNII